MKIQRINEFLNTQELSKDVIVLDKLKNYEIVKLSKKLANMSKKQGIPVDDVVIQMSFKPLYGNNVVISLNDITFEKVHGENTICINFTNGDVGKGLFYWDNFDNEWYSKRSTHLTFGSAWEIN